MPTAVQNLDGTFNIKDVLIFAELPPGARGNDRKIGKRWMEAAIKTAEFREQEQDYLPPLHILHHGQEKPTRAGHFKVTRVERITYDGRETFALLADLVDIPAEMFARVRQGEFPYRSVEIFAINAEPGDKEPPVINGLALLDTEEPFFRFPLLNGKTIDMTGAATFKTSGLDVIRAHEGAVALFSKFPEGIMPANATVKLKGTSDNVTVTLKGNKHEPETIIDALRALMERDDMDDELRAKLAAIMDPDDAEEFVEEDKPTATPATPTKDDKKMSKEHATQFAAQEARIAALTDRLDSNDSKAEAKDLADAEIAKFAAEGYHLSAETKATFRKFAKDPDSLEVFAKTYRATAIKEPKTLEQMENTAPTDSPEVAKFANDPDKHAFATSCEAQYEELKQFGAQPRCDLETFIEQRMNERNQEVPA